MNLSADLIYQYVFTTISGSYLLMFTCFYTCIHIFHTRIIKRPRKLKEGVSYDIDYAFSRNEPDFITNSAFIVNIFSVVSLPIAALSSNHYWGFLGLSTLFIIFLFLSDVSFVNRNKRGNEGLIAYLFIPLWYFPALGISIIIYLLFY